MAEFCAAVPGPKMANMLEEGDTPILPPEQLEALGYRIAAYPLTLIASAVAAMQEALGAIRAGRTPERRVDFATLRETLGFDDYDAFLRVYDEAPPRG